MVFGGKKVKIWPQGQIDPNGTHPPPKHVFGCTVRKSTLLRVSCGRIEGTKKNKKSTRGCKFTHMPNQHPIFCVHHILHYVVGLLTKSHMPDFKWIGSRVSEPQVAENDHPPLTWNIALTTVYALTCYTVTNSLIFAVLEHWLIQM